MPRLVRRRWLLTGGLLASLAACAAPGPGAVTDDRPTVVIDPGHTPEQPGALGVRGVREVVYNDRFAARLAQAFRQAGYPVELTRQPGQSIGLEARATLANAVRGSALLLSIHHDSAQLAYLQPIETAQGPGMRTTRPLAGYSLFVSQHNSAYDSSLRLARALGDTLGALGRAPARHHAEDIAGERRAWLDEPRGVYRYDDLVVLAHTRIPAVLIELGVIVDEADEAYVSQEEKQAALCQAIVAGVGTWRP